MKKMPLEVIHSTLSLKAISNALRITEGEALEKFKDARVVSPLAEIWGETIFRYKRHVSSNHPGSDANLQLGSIGRFEISVRCMGRRYVKFQKSKYIGSGRKCTMDDLVKSVEDVECVVVVDLREFPKLSFYPIDSKAI